MRTSVEDKCNNETIETQHFGENQDQDHTNEESGLLSGTAHTGVTDDADGETSGKTSETDRKTSAELDETSVERHGCLDVARDEHADHKTVNGNDTSHDDGNNTLDQKIRSKNTHGRDTDTGLGSTVRGTETYSERGMTASTSKESNGETVRDRCSERLVATKICGSDTYK